MGSKRGTVWLYQLRTLRVGTKRFCSGNVESTGTSHSRHGPTRVMPLTALFHVAMVLHEEEMSYHSVITTAIQGEEDFHPECPSSVASMLGTEVESELSGAAIDE